MYWLLDYLILQLNQIATNDSDIPPIGKTSSEVWCETHVNMNKMYSFLLFVRHSLLKKMKKKMKKKNTKMMKAVEMKRKTAILMWTRLPPTALPILIIGNKVLLVDPSRRPPVHPEMETLP